MSKTKKNQVNFRIWIFSDGEKLLGKGRVELLERIDCSGSILKAAKEMKMSYRQAWQMVQEMNERANQPLVEKHLGGKHGGGAALTESGKLAIVEFHNLESKVAEFILKESIGLQI